MSTYVGGNKYFCVFHGNKYFSKQPFSICPLVNNRFAFLTLGTHIITSIKFVIFHIYVNLISRILTVFVSFEVSPVCEWAKSGGSGVSKINLI